MIRHRQGNDFLLFTQHDHALLAGQLAERLGGPLARRPSDATLAAIMLHDSGWPLHDDHPTIDAAGEPLHVFQTPPTIAVKVWTASVQNAARQGDYTGLLVSLHVLNLAAMAAALPTNQDAHDVFALNKFKHAQIELQEQLRPRLGLSIDRPLTHGLAPPGVDDREDALRTDVLLLRAMDVLSLSLLCEKEMRQYSAPAPFLTGGEALLHVHRTAEFNITLGPWLFNDYPLALDVPARRFPMIKFETDEALRDAYDKSACERVTVRLTAATV